MDLRLYVVPASHPCACVEAALQLKGLDYTRVDLLPIAHVVHQRLAFGKRTVPGLKVDGGRIVGSRLILRALEAIRPEPPLLPPDPGARARVEEAEIWGEEVLQPLGRRLVWAALRRRPDAMESYAEGANLPVPVGVAMAGAGVVTRLEVLLNGAREDAVRTDIAELPAHLDRVDGWIADGRIGGDAPNAADLQIGACIALLLTLEDLRETIAARPAAVVAKRLFPHTPGHSPAGALPAG